jgi:hypothetical protein
MQKKRSVRSAPESVVLASAALLLALAIASSFAAAQDMTPEQRAFVEQMMRQQGIDPAVLEQAAAAQRFDDVTRYRVVGVYQTKTNVSADPNWMAFADVGDRVELNFAWKLSEGQLVGTPALQNHAATLANPRNPEPKCAPPKVDGRYEQDLRIAKQGIGANLELQFEVAHPAVQAPQFCTGAPKAIAARRVGRRIDLPVPAPTLLSMNLPASGDVRVSSDKKSLIYAREGWTWTYTPVPAR